jgi:hypothetical protein
MLLFWVILSSSQILSVYFIHWQLYPVFIWNIDPPPYIFSLVRRSRSYYVAGQCVIKNDVFAGNEAIRLFSLIHQSIKDILEWCQLTRDSLYLTFHNRPSTTASCTALSLKSIGLFTLAHIFSSSDREGGGFMPFILHKSRSCCSIWFSQSIPRALKMGAHAASMPSRLFW